MWRLAKESTRPEERILLVGLSSCVTVRCPDGGAEVNMGEWVTPGHRDREKLKAQDCSRRPFQPNRAVGRGARCPVVNEGVRGMGRFWHCTKNCTKPCVWHFAQAWVPSLQEESLLQLRLVPEKSLSWAGEERRLDPAFINPF